MIQTYEYVSSALRRTLVLQNINHHLQLYHSNHCNTFFRNAGVLLATILFVATAFGQTQITLSDAIETAVKNNLTISNERLKTEHAKTLIKSAANLPSTMLNGEFGQFNSAYFDTRVAVSQSFSMPAVYNRQKQLFTKEWEASMLNVSLKEFELKKMVTETFYGHIYLKEKEKLLTSIDSLYENLLQKASLRLQKGESNVLEKTTFETQRTGIQLQLVQIKQQLLMVEEIIKLLLNTDVQYVPSATGFKMNEQQLPDLSNLQEHPYLKIAGQQQQIAKANIDVERSKLLPELIAGYSNTSIQGTGANDVKYTAGQRFHSGQLGIGIPIFTGAQKARIKASRINEQIATNNYNIEKQALQNTYLKSQIQYQQNKRMLLLYQDQYLKNVNTIKETANRQFVNGDINYLEFVMLINQAIHIENGYIDMLNEYNNSLIALMYLNK